MKRQIRWKHDHPQGTNVHGHWQDGGSHGLAELYSGRVRQPLPRDIEVDPAAMIFARAKQAQTEVSARSIHLSVADLLSSVAVLADHARNLQRATRGAFLAYRIDRALAGDGSLAQMAMLSRAPLV